VPRRRECSRASISDRYRCQRRRDRLTALLRHSFDTSTPNAPAWAHCSCRRVYRCGQILSSTEITAKGVTVDLSSSLGGAPKSWRGSVSSVMRGTPGLRHPSTFRCARPRCSRGGLLPGATRHCSGRPLHIFLSAHPGRPVAVSPVRRGCGLLGKAGASLRLDQLFPARAPPVRGHTSF
jgi:hypothetical protein